MIYNIIFPAAKWTEFKLQNNIWVQIDQSLLQIIIYKEIIGIGNSQQCGALCLLDGGPCQIYFLQKGNCSLANILLFNNSSYDGMSGVNRTVNVLKSK